MMAIRSYHIIQYYVKEKPDKNHNSCPVIFILYMRLKV